MQSLHDGERFRHTPQRLSVFIEAPRGAIDDVIAAHEVVRQMLDHNGCSCPTSSPRGRDIARYQGGTWQSVIQS